MLRGLSHRTINAASKILRTEEKLRRRKMFFESLEDRSLMATLTWDGGGMADNFNDALNWDNAGSNQLPVSGDTLLFSGVDTPALITNDIAAGAVFALQFTAGGYTIAGNSITLNQTTTTTAFGIQSTTGINSVNTPLALGDATNTLEVTGGTLALGGLISGGAGNALSKTGLGSLTLSGASNSYTGATVVNAGVLRVENIAATGTTSSVTVNAGVLELAGGVGTYARPLNLNNGSTLRASGGSVTYSVASNPVIASGATVAFATVNAGDTLNIGSGYANAVGATVTPTINIAGPGMVALNSGSGAFRGNWNVQAGVLRVSGNNSFGEPDAAVPLTGSTLTFSGGNLQIGRAHV